MLALPDGRLGELVISGTTLLAFFEEKTQLAEAARALDEAVAAESDGVQVGDGLGGDPDEARRPIPTKFPVDVHDLLRRPRIMEDPMKPNPSGIIGGLVR